MAQRLREEDREGESRMKTAKRAKRKSKRGHVVKFTKKDKVYEEFT